MGANVTFLVGFLKFSVEKISFSNSILVRNEFWIELKKCFPWTQTVLVSWNLEKLIYCFVSTILWICFYFLWSKRAVIALIPIYIVLSGFWFRWFLPSSTHFSKIKSKQLLNNTETKTLHPFMMDFPMRSHVSTCSPAYCSYSTGNRVLCL